MSMDKSENCGMNEDDEKSVNSKDQYHDWSPMKGMSESLLNTLSNEGEDTVVQLTGVRDLQSQDTLCPFNDGSGRCYKASCRYKHVPYSTKELNELPKLLTASLSTPEPLVIFSSLPCQVLPATGCISKVVVTAALEPDNFFVVPEKGWKCLCNEHEENHTRDGNFPSSNYYSTLASIQSGLLGLSKECLKERRIEYTTGELVAVKLQTVDNENAWNRAKVLHDTVECGADDESLFKPVNVALELIDYGVTCVKSTNDVIPLPTNFVYVSPLAYKCQLYGISPLMGRWSTSAIKRFRELVLGGNIIAEVVRTATTIERVSECMMVKLYPKALDGEFIDVGEDLIDLGFGIKWNL